MERGKLARVHRVRTLQLGLTRAEEARAHERHANEATLSARIGALADAVSPAIGGGAGGFSLSAAAHFRERLHQSAAAAQSRLENAERTAHAATEASRAAHRDQSAVEKLIARADVDAMRSYMRSLEDTPPSRRNRHDPC